MSLVASFWLILFLTSFTARRPGIFPGTGQLQVLVDQSHLLRSFATAPRSPFMDLILPSRFLPAVRQAPPDIDEGLRLAIRVAKADSAWLCIRQMETTELMTLLPSARFLQLFVPEDGIDRGPMVEDMVQRALAHRLLDKLGKNDDGLYDVACVLRQDVPLRHRVLVEGVRILSRRAQDEFQGSLWACAETAVGAENPVPVLAIPEWEMFAQFALADVDDVVKALDAVDVPEVIAGVYADHQQVRQASDFQQFLSTWDRDNLIAIPDRTRVIVFGLPLVAALLDQDAALVATFQAYRRFARHAYAFFAPVPPFLDEDRLCAFLDSYVQELLGALTARDLAKYRSRIRFLRLCLRRLPFPALFGFFSQTDDLVYWVLACWPQANVIAMIRMELGERILPKPSETFEEESSIVQYFVHTAQINVDLGLPEHCALSVIPNLRIGWVASDDKPFALLKREPLRGFHHSVRWDDNYSVV